MQAINKLQEIVDKYQLPYLDVLVYKASREMLNFKHNANGEERLQMYSMSKIFTVVSALQLIEQGKLFLEDKVEKFFPCFSKTYYKAGEETLLNPTPVTIKHLLTMTSGLSYNVDTPYIKEVQNQKGDNATLADFIPAFVKEPLLFESGKSFEYSLSHDVLAGVVEVVSGKPFDEYVEENIFKPLEMQSATFRNYQGKIHAKFVCNEDLTVTPTTVENNLIFSKKYISGGAGLVCTVKDYAKLVKALTNLGTAENGNKILQEKTVQSMIKYPLPNEFVKHSLDWLSSDYGYGLGVRVRLKDSDFGLKKGEFGWDGACGSYWLSDIEGGVSIVIGMNILEWNLKFLGIHPEIVKVIYSALNKV